MASSYYTDDNPYKTIYSVEVAFDTIFLVAALGAIAFAIVQQRRQHSRDSSWLAVLLLAIAAFIIGTIFDLAIEGNYLRAYTDYSYDGGFTFLTSIIISTIENFFYLLADFTIAALFLKLLAARRSGIAKTIATVAFVVLVLLGLIYFAVNVWQQVLNYQELYDHSSGFSRPGRAKRAHAELVDIGIYLTYVCWNLLYTTAVLVAAGIGLSSSGVRGISLAAVFVTLFFWDVSWVLRLASNALRFTSPEVGIETVLYLPVAFDVVESFAYVVAFFMMGTVRTGEKVQYHDSFLG